MKNPDVKFYLRKRYFVCLWTCVGFMTLMLFASSLSIALVELTSDKHVTTENGTIVIVSISICFVNYQVTWTFVTNYYRLYTCYTV